jgi:hypothetical protein
VQLTADHLEEGARGWSVLLCRACLWVSGDRAEREPSVDLDSSIVLAIDDLWGLSTIGRSWPGLLGL